MADRQGTRRLRKTGLLRWLCLAIGCGLLSGVSSVLLLKAIEGTRNLFLDRIAGVHVPVEGSSQVIAYSAARPWLLPVVVAAGILLAALIAMLASESRGIGTNTAIHAFHHPMDVLAPRIWPTMLVVSSLTIGAGGSAGREAPAALMGSTTGRNLGRLFGVPDHSQRLLLAVGAGSAMGAILKAPVAGAIIAAELFYVWSYEWQALLPGAIASFVAFGVAGLWIGWGPLFEVPDASVPAGSFVWFLAIGLACGALGKAFTLVFHPLGRRLQDLRVPPYVLAPVGGVGVGLIAISFPEVLGTGYGWLQTAIAGDFQRLSSAVVLGLIPLKTLATILTIRMRGSGGLIGPALFLGGMVGTAFWLFLPSNAPWLPSNAAPFVLVGMLALLASTAKLPLTALALAGEFTRRFDLLLPTLLAIGAAYVAAWTAQLYPDQPPKRSDSPAHRHSP